MIKNVPDGQKAGSALVSYNENAFESYELKRNENSSICTNCARTYVEGLNALFSDGIPFRNEKNKEIFFIHIVGPATVQQATVSIQRYFFGHVTTLSCRKWTNLMRRMLVLWQQ